ncbi:AAA family ATPase [Uniformispora flossi]|uniref:AAA family ATPase n=1 Tax=Uniformispora flossi TaxID=3390723 RepID=UPI003C2D15A6
MSTRSNTPDPAADHPEAEGTLARLRAAVAAIDRKYADDPEGSAARYDASAAVAPEPSETADPASAGWSNPAATIADPRVPTFGGGTSTPSDASGWANPVTSLDAPPPRFASEEAPTPGNGSGWADPASQIADRSREAAAEAEEAAALREARLAEAAARARGLEAGAAEQAGHGGAAEDARRFEAAEARRAEAAAEARRRDVAAENRSAPPAGRAPAPHSPTPVGAPLGDEDDWSDPATQIADRSRENAAEAAEAAAAEETRRDEARRRRTAVDAPPTTRSAAPRTTVGDPGDWADPATQIADRSREDAAQAAEAAAAEDTRRAEAAAEARRRDAGVAAENPGAPSVPHSPTPVGAPLGDEDDWSDPATQIADRSREDAAEADEAVQRRRAAAEAPSSPRVAAPRAPADSADGDENDWSDPAAQIADRSREDAAEAADARHHRDDAPAPGAPRRSADPGDRPPAAPSPEAVEAVSAVLARGGAPGRFAGSLVRALGAHAADVLGQDPWALLSVPELTPAQADLFARGLLGQEPDPDDPRRTGALVGWRLRHAAARDGHTALDRHVLRTVLGEFGVRDADAALRAAYESGRVMAFAEPLPPAPEPDPGLAPENDEEAFDDDEAFDVEEDEAAEDPFAAAPERAVLVALEPLALAEESIAEAVLRLNSTVAPADFATSGLPADAGVVLYATGPGEDPPGVPLALVRQAADAGARVVVAAPTPDGRGRLAAAGPPDAVTVAGLLRGAEGPGRDADGCLAADVLLVAEAHLLDVRTAAALLDALPDGARVVLAGDPDELGSAGPGRVFADLRDSGAVPTVASDASRPGLLGTLAQSVRGGVLPPVDSPDREVVLVGARAAAEAVHRCVQLVADSIPRALGFAPDDVLVVAPSAAGPTGTLALNTALKERLNPGPGRFGGFDVGDRVVHAVPTAADPDGRAAVAREGRIVDAGPDGLVLAYREAPGTRVPLPRERTGELRHGWAVTVRQALGVRRTAVVAVLPGEAAGPLPRALVYTAFTRATEHLSVVYAADGSLQQAVARRAGPPPRTTRLADAVRAAVRDY